MGAECFTVKYRDWDRIRRKNVDSDNRLDGRVRIVPRCGNRACVRRDHMSVEHR